MKQDVTILLVLALAAVSHSTAQCIPGKSCKPPNCRCWDDPNSPGGIPVGDIPQVVLISFEYAVNIANENLYRGLFRGVTNPNGCPTTGTFFVQKLNTDFTVMKKLYNEGYEVGMTSINGQTPKSAKEWKDNFTEMKKTIGAAGIPISSVLGARSPELFNGGNDQLQAMKETGLKYDSTCTSKDYTQAGNLLWPYTYDFIDSTPKCVSGTTPSKKFPGLWQFLVAELTFQGHLCASPSSCSPYIKDAQDAFDLLYDSFALHYEGRRTPYVLYIDPLWLTVDYQLQGTRQFIQFVRAAFPDTWLLTTQQSLAWIESPVSSANATKFKPWKC